MIVCYYTKQTQFYRNHSRLRFPAAANCMVHITTTGIIYFVNIGSKLREKCNIFMF